MQTAAVGERDKQLGSNMCRGTLREEGGSREEELLRAWAESEKRKVTKSW